MSLQNTPPFVRYFKARIKPFTKPIVWGSTAVLLLGAWAIWEYRTNPDWLGNDPDRPSIASEGVSESLSESGLSPEELASVAELDSLELLVSEFEKTKPIPLIDSSRTSVQSPQKDKDQAQTETQENQRISLENPFIKQLNQPISRTSVVPDNQQQRSGLNVDTSNPTSTSRNGENEGEQRESPLTTALRQVNLQNITNNSNSEDSQEQADSESSESEGNVAQRPVNPDGSMGVNNNIYTNHQSNFRNPQNFNSYSPSSVNNQTNFSGNVNGNFSPVPGQNLGTNPGTNLNQTNFNTSQQNEAQGFRPLMPQVNTSNPSLRSNLRGFEPVTPSNVQGQTNLNPLTPPITTNNPRLNSNLRNP